MGNRHIRRFLLVGLLVVGVATLIGPVAGAMETGIVGADENTQPSDATDTVVLEAGDENVSVPISSDKPTIEYEFDGGYADRFIVEGYRNGRLGPFPDVRVGETLRIPIRVTNTGDSADTYSLTLQKDGEQIETKSGELAPGEETVVEFTVEFDDPAEEISELEIADWSTLVKIYDRNTMVLTELNVSNSTVDVGEQVTVTATIENGDTPSSETVEILNFNESLSNETVSLDAGETTTVETTTTIEKAYGASFSVVGDFVTGHYTTVSTGWEGNQSTWEFNESAWNVSDTNRTDWEANSSGFNDTDWEFNESELNISDINDSEYEFNNSGEGVLEINDSDLEFNESDKNVSNVHEPGIVINESNSTASDINESEFESNESDPDTSDGNTSNVESPVPDPTTQSQRTESDSTSSEPTESDGTLTTGDGNASTQNTSTEVPGFGIGTAIIGTLGAGMFVIRRR